MSFATMMVHVEVERDSEQRVQLALALSNRFEATLIGVAGFEPRPTFAGAGIAVYTEPSADVIKATTARFDDMGKRFRTQGRDLKQVEWRCCPEAPVDVIVREARAADLIILGARRTPGNAPQPVDPGIVLLRAGRPVLVVPDTIGPLQLHRVVMAWKDTRECRRAVRDAIPLLRQAKEVVLLGIGEDETEAQGKAQLGDVTAYLALHAVTIAAQVWRPGRGPVATELLSFVRDERADMIVAGGYGHSRLGEWIFGGVTHELLGGRPICCMLSH